MKVALVVPGGVDRSGEQRVIPALLWLIERLAQRLELHVFALHQEPEPARYELLGATVHNIGRAWTRLRTLGALLAEHRRRPFAVLHGFWATPPGVLAAIAGGMLGRPVVLHLAGGELVALPDISYGALRGARSRLWVRVALYGASRITAASSPMIEAAAQLGVQVERLPLGVDLARWPVHEPRPRVEGRPARLLHVGSLNLVKDQRTLLLAASVLYQRGAPFRLEIAGADTLSGAVQNFAESLGLSGHVWFHGFVPQSQLRPLMEAADLLLVSSRHEAGPVVMLEAAVAGVPTVGTAVGHVRDWSPDAAVAVPVGDYEGLARETMALIADEARRVRLAMAAQALAVREDADWTAQRVVALYHELAGSGAGT